MRAERIRRGMSRRQPGRGVRMVGALVGLLVGIPLGGATCVVQAQTHQAGTVLCTIPEDADVRSVRLEVRFGGFHDDSLVDMALRVDGETVRCGPDDRVELSGESGDEGEVTLFCRVPVASSEGRHHQLSALLRFRHAELADVRLVPASAPDR